MATARLKHVAICTKDPDATAEFFQRFFDLDLVERNDVGEYRYVFLTDGDLNLALLDFKTEAAARAFNVEGGPSFVGVHHIGFMVDDPAVVLARLKASQARVVEPPAEPGRDGVHFEFKVFDPNGILVDVATGWPGVSR